MKPCRPPGSLSRAAMPLGFPLTRTDLDQHDSATIFFIASLGMEAVMAKKTATRRGGSARRPTHGTTSAASAYLAAREALRRISRSSQLASLTGGALTINWAPGLRSDG
jgi:hypothetical protein